MSKENKSNTSKIVGCICEAVCTVIFVICMTILIRGCMGR